MQIKVLCFAQLKEALGEQLEFTLEAPHTAETLRAGLITGWPQHQAMIQSSRIAVNCEYVAEGQSIQPNDEVALIPPVSGG